jgi:hypothetical protein
MTHEHQTIIKEFTEELRTLNRFDPFFQEYVKGSMLSEKDVRSIGCLRLVLEKSQPVPFPSFEYEEEMMFI